MIPWAALKALPWKWIAAGVLGLALILTGVRINAWRHAYLALQDVQAALEAERECSEGTECAKRAAEATVKAQAASNAAEESHAEELELVRRDRPVRVVRLRPPGDCVSVSSPAPAVNGATPATSVIPGSTGRDIGPELYALAREADELSARLRSLQNYNKALSEGMTAGGETHPSHPD